MGFKILFVLALSVYLASGASTREETDDSPPKMDKNDEGRPIEGYDCSDKRIGNHNHPTECTKYISCNHGGLAYEMDCALCNPGDPRCPEGRTHYNYAEDACLWPDEAGCSGPADPPTTTTTGPGPTTTESTKERCPLLDEIPGSPCNPDDCQLCGDCQRYHWCERIDESGAGSDHKGKGKEGFVRNGTCNPEYNLYFNPTKTSGGAPLPNSIHGGVCDYWANLPPEIKEKYHTDDKCIDPHCEWREIEECSGRYKYFNPDRKEGEPEREDEVELECPRPKDEEFGLIWSQDAKNCLHCSEVFRKDEAGRQTTNCCHH